MNIYYKFSEVKKILPPDRVKELEKLIADNIQPAYTKSGKEIEKAVVLIKPGSETGSLYLRGKEGDYTQDYVTQEAMNLFLTEEEKRFIVNNFRKISYDQHEKELFEKAEKIPVAEYDGLLWWGDEYFFCVEDLIERLEEDDLDKPQYVWAAKPVQVINPVSVFDVFENQIENRGWEDMDAKDLEGVEELQAALDKFVELNKDVKSYWEDNKKAIIL